MKAIILDAFGTIMQIGDPRHPYKKVGADRSVMTSEVLLSDLTDDLSLMDDLHAELRSIALYPDFEPFAKRCRDEGIKLAIGSNLAAPYATVVRTLVGSRVDHFHLSCEVGFIKPDIRFFNGAMVALGAEPHEILMIGDSIKSDLAGSRSAGMHGQLITRPDESLMDYFDIYYMMQEEQDEIDSVVPLPCQCGSGEYRYERVAFSCETSVVCLGCGHRGPGGPYNIGAAFLWNEALS